MRDGEDRNGVILNLPLSLKGPPSRGEGARPPGGSGGADLQAGGETRGDRGLHTPQHQGRVAGSRGQG